VRIWRESLPWPVLATVRDQLGLATRITLDGYFEGRSRIRHLALIRHRFGFTDFGDNAGARFRLTRWLGRYDFLLPDAVADGGLRPLRQPTSEWDF